MHFSYNKLFKLMIDRNIKKKELSEMSDVSATSIAKLVIQSVSVRIPA